MEASASEHKAEPRTSPSRTESANRRTREDLPPGWRFKHDGQIVSFKVEGLLGKGSFGTVYKATMLETDEVVAVKQVEIERRYPFREVGILATLHHRNICRLKMSFFVTRNENRKEAFMILEYVPCCLYNLITHYNRQRRRMTEEYIILCMYQLLKGLAFIHSKGVCHRDLKPENILVNLDTHELKICDFGCAKVLNEAMDNTTYVCSRYYRAPELILDSPYTKAVDVWSAGCIFGEMYTSQVLFKGKTRVDQMVEILTVLGTPTQKDLEDMQKEDLPCEVNVCHAMSWTDVLGSDVGEHAIDLISQMLRYSPKRRITAADALRHAFFDPLRRPDFPVPSGVLPQLFDSEEERLNRRDSGGCTDGVGSASNAK